jgi:hypothetical protein
MSLIGTLAAGIAQEQCKSTYSREYRDALEHFDRLRRELNDEEFRTRAKKLSVTEACVATPAVAEYVLALERRVQAAELDTTSARVAVAERKAELAEASAKDWERRHRDLCAELRIVKDESARRAGEIANRIHEINCARVGAELARADIYNLRGLLATAQDTIKNAVKGDIETVIDLRAQLQTALESETRLKVKLADRDSWREVLGSDTARIDFLEKNGLSVYAADCTGRYWRCSGAKDKVTYHCGWRAAVDSVRLASTEPLREYINTDGVPVVETRNDWLRRTGCTARQRVNVFLGFCGEPYWQIDRPDGISVATGPTWESAVDKARRNGV